jgi:lysophospholipase L1-like esterase
VGNGHLSRFGYRVMAEAVAERLKEWRLVPAS